MRELNIFPETNPSAGWCETKNGDYTGSTSIMDNDFSTIKFCFMPEDCVFPFIYGGKKRWNCIMDDSKEPWCSTGTDKDHNYLRGKY